MYDIASGPDRLEKSQLCMLLKSLVKNRILSLYLPQIGHSPGLICTFGDEPHRPTEAWRKYDVTSDCGNPDWNKCEVCALWGPSLKLCELQFRLMPEILGSCVLKLTGTGWNDCNGILKVPDGLLWYIAGTFINWPFWGRNPLCSFMESIHSAFKFGIFPWLAVWSPPAFWDTVCIFPSPETSLSGCGSGEADVRSDEELEVSDSTAMELVADCVVVDAMASVFSLTMRK